MMEFQGSVEMALLCSENGFAYVPEELPERPRSANFKMTLHRFLKPSDFVLGV
jgi:hypothetical protein